MKRARIAIAVAVMPMAATCCAREALVVENQDLKVSVATAGTISVFDKSSKLVWDQRRRKDQPEFSHVRISASTAISFDATFSPGRPMPMHVALQLHGRELTLRVGMDDTNTPITAFDFLEPFVPATNMSVVIPDFCDGHIYPCNLAAWPQYNLDSIRVLNLTMPWVAMVDVDRGDGYSVTFDTPWDAQLKLQAEAGLRAPRVAWNPQLGRFGYPRSVTYAFTARGGYVALAKAYRDHAEADGWLVKLSDKAKTRPAITNLYGAPVLWDFNDLLPDQTLRARGVARAIHHVERWDAGNANRARLDLANQLGFVTEEYDYYLAGPVDGREQQYQDYHIDNPQCVKDATGQITRGEHDWGMRCTESYLPTAGRIIPARLKMYPQTARYFDQLTQNFNGHDLGLRGGGSTEECYAPEHIKSRAAWVRDVDALYRYAAQSLGLITGAELGKFHQVPSTELFYGMESWCWPWPDAVFPAQRGPDTNAWSVYEHWAMNPGRRVPLWELVFHDCAVATLYPWDGNDVCYQMDGSNQDLKDCLNLLYGTPATFLVAGTDKSQYFHHQQRWLQSYRNTCKILESLADKEMLRHRFLTSDRQVQQTEWSDGTRITVNFGTNAFWAEEKGANRRRLDQFCFTASGPWGAFWRAFQPRTESIATYLQKPDYHFDDSQLSAGQPISLALWLRARGHLQVNVDEIPGQTHVGFFIQPAALQPDWNFKQTRVFLCNPDNGNRLRELPWQPTGADGIRVNDLSGWISLEVVDDDL